MKTESDCCASGGSINRTNEHYDLAVIGAGSAGFSSAITAAERGARVALIGYGMIGGTCVNIGCVPSKTLIRAAEAIHQANAAPRFGGVEASARVTDWPALMKQKAALVAELRSAKYENLLPKYESISYMEGWAKLVDGGVEVNGAPVKADKIIIATGSSPALPPIAGIESVPYLTSTSALELEELPKSMIVIGGGVIGCELGQMFARLGVHVTLMCRSHLLPAQEPEISEALQQYLEAEGIDVICGASYVSVSHRRDIHLAYERGGQPHIRSAEQILVAAGRSLNSTGLGLKEAGITLERNGGIRVDAHMRTSRKDVYAAGDVTGRDMFVYMAAYGAKIAALNALDSDANLYDSSAMPEVIFTDPQVASVGMTQRQAKARGLVVATSVLPLEYLPRALAARDTRGVIKLVADKGTGHLLGAHILAPEGADSIQTAALAIKMGIRVEELGGMIFPYLTNVEGLKLAAQSFGRDIAKLSCCAG